MLHTCSSPASNPVHCLSHSLPPAHHGPAVWSCSLAHCTHLQTDKQLVIQGTIELHSKALYKRPVIAGRELHRKVRAASRTSNLN